MKPDRRIRVLHLVEDMRTGGLERVIAALAQGTDRARFDVAVWCLARGGEVADALSSKGVAVRVLGMPSRFALGFAPKLSAMLKEDGTDIVHCHGYTAATVGRAAALLARTPVIIAHQHSVYTEYSARQIWTERLLSRFSDRVICCSQAVREFVVGREGVSPDKAVVVYNGTDCVRHAGPQEARRRLGLREDEFVVGSVGSLVPNKGQANLIKAAGTLARAGRLVRLVLVGDGPLRRELEESAAAEGVDAVFTGRVDDVFAILEAFDVLALPSVNREGLSLALVEGLCCGKPLLASRLQGMVEVVHDGENGLLVPPGDISSLASALERLASDGALRSRLGLKSLEFYKERFTLRRMLEEVEQIYEDCLASR